MAEIEVGEYVRTTDGKIAIFDRYSSRKEESLYKSPFNCFIKLQGRKTPLQCNKDYIAKHSKHLFDLIEVGDIVNGYRILEIYEPTVEGEERILDIGYGMAIFNDEIKTILTKEQMEANCYKVGGE